MVTRSRSQVGVKDGVRFRITIMVAIEIWFRRIIKRRVLLRIWLITVAIIVAVAIAWLQLLFKSQLWFQLQRQLQVYSEPPPCLQAGPPPCLQAGPPPCLQELRVQLQASVSTGTPIALANCSSTSTNWCSAWVGSGRVRWG